LIEGAAIALDRIRGGRAAQSFVFYGLRGVGKTVLLNSIQKSAEGRGFSCVWIEAPEEKSLLALLAPALRAAMIGLSRGEKVRSKLGKALQALAGFAKALKVKFQDIEFNVDYKPEKGVEAAEEHRTALVLFIDELQYVPEDQLASLIMALHRANQKQLPVTLLAADLPQLIGQMGRAKSYAERLFKFESIDSLDAKAAREALVLPARREKVRFEDDAIASILAQTKGYPYFLQEWGKHSWNVAESSPIRKSDAERAAVIALAELDNSFFRVRSDRLTAPEKRYMRAMAELGPGPHRSGEIAGLLGKDVTAVAPLRNNILSKGMIYSPAHGDTAFTVPLFDGYLKRILPKFEKEP